MTNSYNQIANVTIDVATTIADETSFDSILIVGPAPAVAPATAPAPVKSYSSLEEVSAAGWAINDDNTANPAVVADPVGVAARVAFSQNPSPSHIYIAVLQTSTTTENDQTVTVTEAPESAVARAMATPGWYVVCPAGIENNKLSALAAYIEDQEKMMVYTELGFFGTGTNGANQATVNSPLSRTVAVFGKESSTQTAANIPTENKYANVAFAVAWLANESGSETAAFKRVSVVKPAELSEAELTNLKDGHISYLTTIGGKNITMIGQVLSGEWCDIIRFRDWLKNDMQVSVASLFLANAKIPFTDGGISLVQNAMEASLQRGQDIGGIAETTYDNEGNELLGYQVIVPPASNVSDSDKKARKLSNCKFVARLTGAIHFAELKGSLTYSL